MEMAVTSAGRLCWQEQQAAHLVLCVEISHVRLSSVWSLATVDLCSMQNFAICFLTTMSIAVQFLEGTTAQDGWVVVQKKAAALQRA